MMSGYFPTTTIAKTRRRSPDRRGLHAFVLAVSLAIPMTLGAGAVAAQGHSSETAAGPRDLALEERNREVVLEFHDLAFNKHDFEAAAQLLAEDYIQHNPRVETGKVGFVTSFTRRLDAAGGQLQTASRLLRSASEGDLVWLHTHVTEGENDRGFAVMDVFRVVDGIIVEHWDVIQPVPETAANDNGMF